MQNDQFEERHWFSEQDYMKGLAFCQLSPDLWRLLAIYLGWLRAGILGDHSRELSSFFLRF
jgi:chromate transport protein ChrA